MTRSTVLGLFLAIGGAISPAVADPVELADYLININGTLYTNTAPPGATGNMLSSTLSEPAISNLVLTLGPGTYNVGAYLDWDVDAAFQFNEYGFTGGGLPAGDQTWQIDASRLAGDLNFPSPTLYSNVSSNALDGKNHVGGSTDNLLIPCGANGGGSVDTTCNTDVAWGMGFGNIVVGAGDEALVTFTASTTLPASGFYLGMTNPNVDLSGSALTYYLTGDVSIQPVNGNVPEPSSVLLLLPAAVLLLMFRRKWRQA